MSRKRQIYRDRKQIHGCQTTSRLGGMEVIGKNISFKADENVLNSIMVIIVQACEKSKNH